MRAEQKEPIASDNIESLRMGAMKPKTSAEIAIDTHDWTEAAEPRASGNRSSMRRLKVGPASCTPNAMKAIRNCWMSSGGILTAANNSVITAEPLMAKLGINTETVQRGARAGMLSGSAPLSEDERAALMRQIGRASCRERV